MLKTCYGSIYDLAIWTKTLYQKNLNNIVSFFTLFKGCRYNYISVITPKTISRGSPRKQISNFTRIVKTQVKFWKFLCVRCHFVNLTFTFSDSYEKYSLVLLQITILTFIALEKCKKKNSTCFRLFWYKVSSVSAEK